MQTLSMPHALKTRFLWLAMAQVAPAMAVHAQDVQVYGQLRLSANRIESASDRIHELRDNASRLGFRGSEALGGDLSALFGLEMGLEADTGGVADPLYRHSYVGLRHSVGTLAIGRLDSANPTGSPLYSQVTAIVSFAPNDAGATAIGTSILNARNRVSNAIGFRSGPWAQLEWMGRAYLRGAGTADDPEQSARSIDLGLLYRSGPLTAAAGYGKDDRAGGLRPNEFDDKWQIGVRYALGAVVPYAMGGVDRFHSDGTRRRSVDYWLGGAEFIHGPHSVVFNLMQRDVQSSLTGIRRRQQLAYIYRLSQRTQWQVFIDNDGVDSSRDKVRVQALGTGMRHDF
ncbi:porin [Ideonella sp. DXS29W]|uniref:Porin n=1 Tax=Ideonella lacteola TaxID=2984193 RepID=A0ABU9BWG6_9BURK